MEYCDTQTKETKGGQNRVYRLKARVAECLSPNQKWHRNDRLRHDGTPSDHAAIEIGGRVR
jgi:hypothetical protein